MSYVTYHISIYIYMHVYTLHLAREPKLLSPEERTALAVMMRATVSKKGRVRTTSRSTSRVPMTCQTSLALTWQKTIQWPNLHFKQNFREWGIPTYTYIYLHCGKMIAWWPQMAPRLFEASRIFLNFRFFRSVHLGLRLRNEVGFILPEFPNGKSFLVVSIGSIPKMLGL